MDNDNSVLLQIFKLSRSSRRSDSIAGGAGRFTGSVLRPTVGLTKVLQSRIFLSWLSAASGVSQPSQAQLDAFSFILLSHWPYVGHQKGIQILSWVLVYFEVRCTSFEVFYFFDYLTDCPWFSKHVRCEHSITASVTTHIALLSC